LWADKARFELDRIGGRTSVGDDLTPAEAKIARLVARGHTNREVAAELVVAVHTVEAALTRIYAKLGVRSRTELTLRLSGHGGTDPRAPAARRGSATASDSAPPATRRR
jgi:DNA-binding NarL/FixJ family response regulator